MKLRNHQFSTPPQISKHEVIHSSEKSRHDIYREWKHPWYEYNENGCVRRSDQAKLIKPNPPTEEAVKKAAFVDKTYKWKPK